MTLFNLYNGSLKQLVQWLLATLLFPLVFLNGWLALKVLNYFEPLVTVFVLATLLALILNFPVQFLRERGLQRGTAVLIIVMTTIAIVIALGITLIPLLLDDLNEIAQLSPQWIESGSNQLDAFQTWIASRGFPPSFGQGINRVISQLPDQIQTLGNEMVDLTLGTVGSLSNSLLTIVLTFYFLADGKRLADAIFHWLPGHWGETIRRSLQENFQNYFIGQSALGAIVGLSMTIALTLLQIPYSLLFGLGIGVMALIPFGDIVTCTLISILLAFQNFWLGVKVFAIAVIVDQLIDQLVAPRLLGKATGLRPVWVLIALLVGTKIGGLIGLITAVPLTSFIYSALEGFESLSPVSEPEPENGSAIPRPENLHA